MQNLVFIKLTDQLKLHEGVRLKPYKDTVGKLSLGIGRNLDDMGISLKEANDMLINDLLNWVFPTANKIFKNFDSFTANRQIALCDMIFNLGEKRFMGFQNMIEAIKKGNWEEAAVEAKDSTWYNQVGKRAEKVVEQLKKG
jgi:lysozyme